MGHFFAHPIPSTFILLLFYLFWFYIFVFYLFYRFIFYLLSLPVSLAGRPHLKMNVTQGDNSSKSAESTIPLS